MEMLTVFSLIAVALTISSSYAPGVDACGGYKLYVDYFRNCGKNDIIQLSDDFGPVLNEDCTVAMNGCSTVKRSFKTAQVTYDLTRNGAHYTGTKNACQLLESVHGEVLSIMDSIGAPHHCPIKEGTVCAEGKQISIRKHRIKLPMMSGTTKGKMEIKTNSGNACFEFSASLNRRLFSG
ncbi:uncharacterized protein LOC135838108 [Planococcus citri]|uniref:uncharacterized protein LOC135838108 n=1 Tax=Planococcus citri TaxID=170843 RepID=UPI0031F8D1AD